ncbi:hypothetical protein BHE74_00031151 [Ensete ventricosum]|nr:hypothetical protein GW17_00041215 [Ensete ventricosum]RWW61765.1 hypothetical protein BHE74_00031151 [Ensete ventricosum]RZS01063.1 hypothetical protein BHM03_00030859 [Ensete ventricosum]
MLKDHKLKLRPNFRQSGNLRHSCGKSSGLFPVISRHAPSELSDPFGESPSELPVRSHYIVQPSTTVKLGRWWYTHHSPAVYSSKFLEKRFPPLFEFRLESDVDRPFGQPIELNLSSIKP